MKVKVNYSRQVSKEIFDSESKCFITTKNVIARDIHKLLEYKNIPFPINLSYDSVLNLLIVILKNETTYLVILEDSDRNFFEKLELPLESEFIQEKEKSLLLML